MEKLNEVDIEVLKCGYASELFFWLHQLTDPFNTTLFQ